MNSRIVERLVLIKTEHLLVDPGVKLLDMSVQKFREGDVKPPGKVRMHFQVILTFNRINATLYLERLPKVLILAFLFKVTKT